MDSRGIETETDACCMGALLRTVLASDWCYKA